MMDSIDTFSLLRDCESTINISNKFRHYDDIYILFSYKGVLPLGYPQP